MLLVDKYTNQKLSTKMYCLKLKEMKHDSKTILYLDTTPLLEIKLSKIKAESLEEVLSYLLTKKVFYFIQKNISKGIYQLFQTDKITCFHLNFKIECKSIIELKRLIL